MSPKSIRWVLLTVLFAVTGTLVVGCDAPLDPRICVEEGEPPPTQTYKYKCFVEICDENCNDETNRETRIKSDEVWAADRPAANKCWEQRTSDDDASSNGDKHVIVDRWCEYDETNKQQSLPKLTGFEAAYMLSPEALDALASNTPEAIDAVLELAVDDTPEPLWEHHCALPGSSMCVQMCETVDATCKATSLHPRKGFKAPMGQLYHCKGGTPTWTCSYEWGDGDNCTVIFPFMSWYCLSDDKK